MVCRSSQAERSAIAFIHQDLGLVKWMTVAENIALAQGYPRRSGLVDWSAVEATARRSLSLVAHDIVGFPFLANSDSVGSGGISWQSGF